MGWRTMDLECQECNTLLMEHMCSTSSMEEDMTCPECGELMIQVYTTPTNQIHKSTGYGSTKRDTKAWGKYVEEANLKADMVKLPESKRDDHKKELKKLKGE